MTSTLWFKIVLGVGALSLQQLEVQVDAATARAPWNPTPPCPSPVSNSAVSEGMCFDTVDTFGDIQFREYGRPLNATLAVATQSGLLPYNDALVAGVQNIIAFVEGDNVQRVSLLPARTVPIAVRAPNSGTFDYLISMMISTAQFPDPTRIPAPSPPGLLTLTPVREHVFAAQAINTTAQPDHDTFLSLCDGLRLGVLRSSKWIINATSSWSPTFVFYNGQNDKTLWTSECWYEVVPA